LFAERNVDALLLGLLVAAAFSRLGWLALKSSSRDRDWKTIYPWLVLVLYGLISGAVTATGRLRFRTNAAIALRYEPVSVFCYIAVTSLALRNGVRTMQFDNAFQHHYGLFKAWVARSISRYVQAVTRVRLVLEWSG
jgi:hypothetical protein